MLFGIKKTPLQMGQSIPDLRQHMAGAAQQPQHSIEKVVAFEDRILPRMQELEKTLKRFNANLGAATGENAYLTILRSADAIELVMARSFRNAQVFPMTLSIIAKETPSRETAFNVIERGPANRAFVGDRPILRTTEFHDYETDRIIQLVEQAVLNRLSEEEKKALNLKVWPNQYPAAASRTPSPAGAPSAAPPSAGPGQMS